MRHTISGEPTCIADLQSLRSACYVTYAFLRMFTSKKELSAVYRVQTAELFIVNLILFSTVK